MGGIYLSHRCTGYGTGFKSFRLYEVKQRTLEDGYRDGPDEPVAPRLE
jgi:hypothetical protein